MSNKSSTNSLSEGTNNKYYTDGRVDTRFATKTTSNLSEGSNLYYTSARFNSAFSGKSTSDLAEGTNKYYTDARARLSVTGTSPLNVNSGSGAITIQKADATHDGYLAQADFSAFNNKISAGWAPLSPTPGSSVSITPPTGNSVARWIAAQNETINFSVGGALGDQIILMITNDGILARVLTLGTNIRSLGIITGITSKISTIHFISDGTTFNEISRAIAMT